MFDLVDLVELRIKRMLIAVPLREIRIKKFH
jgi:hypothetical protein